MPAKPNRRMPLSCEPCRERKIRCPRGPSGTASSPCTSCIRRGIPPHECVYLRDIYNHRPPPSRHDGGADLSDQSGGEPRANPSTTSELLERIRKLEAIVVRKEAPGPGNGAISRLVTPEPQDTSPPLLGGLHSPTASLPSTAGTGSGNPPVPAERKGRIILSTTGHERYEPLGTTWPSVLDGMVAAEDDADDPLASTPTTGQTVNLLADLPAMPHCAELKNVYFDVFAPLFHVLHDPTFTAEYNRFQEQPTAASPAWLALLYAVLGVAVLALDESSPLLQNLGWIGGSSNTSSRHAAAQNMAALTRRYRAATLRCLQADHFLWRHSLHSLQALIVLVYGINHSHGQSWALLGTTRNIALALGCHVDPDQLGGVRMNRVVAEQRRRCWAALTMLYTIQNSTLGGVDPVPLQTDGVRLPLDVDDDQLQEGDGGRGGEPGGDVGHRGGGGHRGTGSTGGRVGPSQMSYILYKFRLYDICARISSQVLATSGTANTYLDRLDAEITAQQQAWNQRYQTDACRGHQPAHHTMHLHILLGYSHQLRLLLHRPVVFSGRTGHGRTTPYSPARLQASRARCLESASALLALLRLLYETDAFRPFRWYTRGLASFHAFHASIFLVYECLAQAQNGAHGDRDDVLDAGYEKTLRSELEGTLRIFEALAATGMSRICEKAAPVLQRFLQSLHTIHNHHSPPPSAQTTVSSDLHMLHGSTPMLNTAECSQGWLPDPMLIADASAVQQSQQLEALLGPVQLRQWLSPSSMNWNDWDIFTNSSFQSDTVGDVS